MWIKFIVDYRGRETGENFFQKGQVADLESEGASFLIADKRAVATKAPVVKKDKQAKLEESALPPEGEKPDQDSLENSEHDEAEEETPKE
jgi:hypothetical protein